MMMFLRIKIMQIRSALFILLVSLFFSINAFSCTDFILSAQDNSKLVTRTLEFADDLASNLRSSNRGRHFQEKTPMGKNALSWTAKYGYLFLDGKQVDAAVDGLNEKGLSIEALYLPEETEYPKLNEENSSRAISYIHFGDWLLGNFQNIEEVRNALKDITVFSTTIPGFGNFVFPLHFAVYDAQGDGLVIEFVKGKMNIHDNRIGILTNSPTYDWHLTNLRNYINLSPYDPTPVRFDGLTFMTTGLGSGMKGMPGDTSPPSRFVKMAVLKKVAYPAKNSQEALVLAQHIVNTVDIPTGLVRAKNGKSEGAPQDEEPEGTEKTQWTVFKDLTNLKFYYRTYENTTLSEVDLSKIDFSENSKRLKMPIASTQFIVDKNIELLNHLSK